MDISEFTLTVIFVTAYHSKRALYVKGCMSRKYVAKMNTSKPTKVSPLVKHVFFGVIKYMFQDFMSHGLNRDPYFDDSFLYYKVDGDVYFRNYISLTEKNGVWTETRLFLNRPETDSC